MERHMHEMLRLAQRAAIAAVLAPFLFAAAASEDTLGQRCAGLHYPETTGWYACIEDLIHGR